MLVELLGALEELEEATFVRAFTVRGSLFVGRVARVDIAVVGGEQASRGRGEGSDRRHPTQGGRELLRAQDLGLEASGAHCGLAREVEHDIFHLEGRAVQGALRSLTLEEVYEAVLGTRARHAIQVLAAELPRQL